VLRPVDGLAAALGEDAGDRALHSLEIASRASEFLDAWPVRWLRLLDREQMDLSPIERLAGTLEVLHVQAAPGAELEVGAFPRLDPLSANCELRGSVAAPPTTIGRGYVGGA